jgi:HAD superfamily hydrolase (TIGR01549 family)
MKQCVIFDYGGTLVYSIEGKVIQEVVRSLGLTTQELDSEKLLKRYYEVWYSTSIGLPRGQRLTPETIGRSMYTAALDVLGNAELAHVVASAYVASEGKSGTRRLYPDVIPTLKELRKAGIQMGIVSENLKLSRDLRTELAHLCKGEYFDSVVTSEEVSLHKPDPKLFIAGARSLGVDPGDCLYVGDSLELDIKGARKAGMDAALICRGEPSKLEATPPSLSSLVDILELLRK